MTNGSGRVYCFREIDRGRGMCAKSAENGTKGGNKPRGRGEGGYSVFIFIVFLIRPCGEMEWCRN